MNQSLYAIRDVKAESIGQIVAAFADAAAVRMFGDVAADSQNLVSRHPEDFELICLGSIDQVGQIEPNWRVVITGAQWKAAQAPKAEV